MVRISPNVDAVMLWGVRLSWFDYQGMSVDNPTKSATRDANSISPTDLQATTYLPVVPKQLALYP
jgi:hypothetical protein